MSKPRDPKDKPKRRRRRQNAWRKEIILNSKARPKNVVANANTILANDPRWRGLLAFDDFSQEVITLRPPEWHDYEAEAEERVGRWTDSDTTRVQAWLQREYGINLGIGPIWNAVYVVAERRRINPLADYLDGLHWDCRPRVESLASQYLGMIEGPYSRLVSRMMMVSAVARAFEPGCKVDTMSVLEGPQGLLKSTALKKLFGAELFSDTPIDLSNKDRFIQLRGKWLIEIAELDSFRGQSAKRIKSFLTSQVDCYRPPYGRGAVDVPRRCVLAGTTNDDTYLVDETGNRRFLPIRCGAINIAAIERDRNQLWAEAVALYRAGIRWWPMGDEVDLVQAEQKRRLRVDAWQPVVEDYLDGVEIKEVTVGDVLSSALNLEEGRWGPVEQKRVVSCLRRAGWCRVQRRRKGADRGSAKGKSKRTYFYVPE